MLNSPENVNWNKIKAVIFDVDGTLYDQRKLRRLMAGRLLKYAFTHPWNWQDIKIISCFRKEREQRAESLSEDLETEQYEWTAKVLGVTPEKVRKVIETWMYKAPLKYLYSCRYSEAADFIVQLREKGIIVTVFSDYPAPEKLIAMEILTDYAFAATDKDINRLKPDPGGPLHISRRLGILPEECLFIGDRDDRDGECARRAGMSYFIVGRDAHAFYKSLSEGLSGI